MSLFPRKPPPEDPDDDDREGTIVRPASRFMTTVIMADATLVQPRSDDDADATVIRHTLQRQRKADITRPRTPPSARLPQRPLALPPGTALHEYRIERVLGQGGFGITYLAADQNLAAQVAIKEYLPEEIVFRAADGSLSANATEHRDRYRQGLENFLVEARTLATFRHANIVRVARFFEANSTAYMVLEYERGRSLRKWWKTQGDDGARLLQERLPPLLDGLAVVHAAGYLHRDIKPDNIQVSSDDGRFVLLDFGSAGLTVALADEDAVVVTPGYAPPEQYGEGEQGPWTDLYALGATLYWAVAGRKPPDAEARAAGTPMPSALEMGHERFGASFLSAIDWALQLDPQARPRNVAEWRRHLLADMPGAAPVAAAPRPAAALRMRRSAAERWWRAMRRLLLPSAWPLTTRLSVLALCAATCVPPALWVAYGTSEAGAQALAAQLQPLQQGASDGAQRVQRALADARLLARALASDTEVMRSLVQPDRAAADSLGPRLVATLRAGAELQAAALVDGGGRVRRASGSEADDAWLRSPPRGPVVVQDHAVVLAEPVRDDSGIVVGHVLLRLALDPLLAAAEAATRARGLPALLLDGHDQLLQDGPGGARGRSLPEPALVAALEPHQPSGGLAYQPLGRGAERLAAWARVPELDWVVVCEAPRATADPLLQRLAGPLWLATGALALLFVALAQWQGRGITRAVQRLTSATHAVRSGDFDHAEVDIPRRDELGLLARSFNGMVDMLRQRQRERTGGRR